MAPQVTFIRKRLERAMKLHGLTTSTELAAALGMSKSNVGRIRSGEIQPGRNTIDALLKAFPELTYEDLFEDTKATKGKAAA